MGGNAAAETMTKKKKKKGRPSLLELQKRSLKQQQQQQEQESANLRNPNSVNSSRRSSRRNPNSDGSSPGGELNSVGGGDEDDERQRKKHKPLVGLQQQHSDLDGEHPEAVALKRRKIGAGTSGSDQTGEKVSKVTDTDALHGSPMEYGPTTPLPDKKLLVFILDRLQKKDTYGVFSEPVDPEELPDYFDIITSPMDFSTLRKKLEEGAYKTLEQFEKDVFLICSNAMQYNAPDTVYFRQARSIQELAKKDFDNLRQDSDAEEDCEPQPKVVRRGRPPGKSQKKLLESSSLDRVGSEFFSDATLATGGDSTNWSNNLRRGTSSYKLRPAETLVRASSGSHNHETYGNMSSEWENEFPASVVRAVTKYGMKHFPVDENKRDTYNNTLASEDEQSLFGAMGGGNKQLIPVGLHEHGYATSLARFAANLGPVVWKIASKKIERVLPPGLRFGPGWVGDNRDDEQRKPFTLSEKEKSSNNHLTPTTTSGSNTILASRFPSQGQDDVETPRRRPNSQGELSTPPFNRVGETKPSSPYHFQQRPLPSSFHGGYAVNYSSPQMGAITPTGNCRLENPRAPSQMLGKVPEGGTSSATSPLAADYSSRLHTNNAGAAPCIPRNKQESHSFQPDLNAMFLAPGSPSSKSSLQIGSPQRPDLALQL